MIKTLTMILTTEPPFGKPNLRCWLLQITHGGLCRACCIKHNLSQAPQSLSMSNEMR